MNFAKLISDGSGEPSTMRVATLFIVLTVVGTWAVAETVMSILSNPGAAAAM